ncbi:MAG TPA: ISLre2 family transposase [Firmicutes bacterium]|nr:ISLre2 family transposase [Candidatus Fermentithermobacillaceae bacterium]
MVKDVRKGTIATLLGDVEYCRRYYFDKKTAGYVYLLDEALGMGRRRISPGLAVVAAIQAVIGPSYRAARDSLKRFYGHQVVSHESIRQLILRLGEFVEEEETRKREEPDGKRQVPVLFVEVDGYWVSMQKEKDREVRMMVSDEGWKPRTPGSDEYELVNKSHYLETDMQREDFWDKASRHLYSMYDIDEKTLVIINGDRAKWIRKGVEYFPKAIYQVDRYHLKRELRDLLRDTQHLENGLGAVDRSDVDGLTEVLKRVRREVREPVRHTKINELLAAIREMPEAFRDYRVRLEEMGYDTRGMRGMGATESNVNKFSMRLKKRGQSWSLEGLNAMIHSMVKYFEDKLDRYAEHVSRVHNLLSEEKVAQTTEEIASKVTTDIYEAKRGGVPLLNVGTSRSGGLSKVLRRLVLPDPAIT